MPNKQVLSSELVDEMKKPTDDGFEFKHPISGELWATQIPPYSDKCKDSCKRQSCAFHSGQVYNKLFGMNI